LRLGFYARGLLPCPLLFGRSGESGRMSSIVDVFLLDLDLDLDLDLALPTLSDHVA
jgi:hypothetical protein